MAKKVKMILYGAPGVGKSVFAGNAPKPFFITTDGNYEWLEGLVPNFNEADHVQVNGWSSALQVFAKLNSPEFDKYETIVIDLVEDLYTWADMEMCAQNKVKHISELGDYGKGYDMLRKPYVAVIEKVLAQDKNVILLSHESVDVRKNKLGKEYNFYGPSKSMSYEKIWDKLCGQVRYCVRAAVEYEADENKKTTVKRVLHIVNQPDEYGTYRLNNPNCPDTIPLDWNVFAEVIGLNGPSIPVIDNPEPKVAPAPTPTPVTPTPVVPTPTPVVEPVAPVVEEVKVSDVVPEPVVEDVPTPTPVSPKEEALANILADKNRIRETFTTAPVTPTPAPAPAPAPVVEEVPAPKAEITPEEVDDNFLLECIKNGLSFNQIEETFNLKLDNTKHVRYTILKTKYSRENN